MASKKRVESVDENGGEGEEAVPKRPRISDAAQPVKEAEVAAAGSKKRAESVNENGGEEEEAVRKRRRFSDAAREVAAVAAGEAGKKAKAAVEGVHSVVISEARKFITKPAAPAAENEMYLLLQELAEKVIKEAEGSELMARFTSLADITDPVRESDPEWQRFSAAKKVASKWAADVEAVGVKVSELMAAEKEASELDDKMVALKAAAAGMMNSIYADVTIYLFLRDRAESAGIEGDNSVSNPGTAVSHNQYRNRYRIPPEEIFLATTDPNNYDLDPISPTNSGDAASDASMVGETSNS